MLLALLPQGLQVHHPTLHFAIANHSCPGGTAAVRPFELLAEGCAAGVSLNA
jgi:hypothetical protein